MPELERAAGRVIADRRRRARLTQEGLAEGAEVDVSYVSQLERGVKSPTLRVLFRLASAMKLPASTLVKGIERELARPEKAKERPSRAKRDGRKASR